MSDNIIFSKAKELAAEIGFDAEKTFKNMVKWVQDYFSNNGVNSKVCVAISGGIDSSVVAAVLVAALGKDRVFGLLEPNGVQVDIKYSYDLCEELGIPHAKINISSLVKGAEDLLTLDGTVKLSPVTKMNMPADLRKLLVCNLARSMNGRVANTDNLSERYLGWVSKHESIGDFCLLRNLTKTHVILIGLAAGLSEKFLLKAPSDGLCGQSDEEKFGFPYIILDRYILTGECDDIEIKKKIDQMHVASLHKGDIRPTFEPDFEVGTKQKIIAWLTNGKNEDLEGGLKLSLNDEFALKVEAGLMLSKLAALRDGLGNGRLVSGAESDRIKHDLNSGVR